MRGKENMSEESLVRNNKLIADFMGYQSESRVGGKRWLINSYWVLPSWMLYKTSWDCIMPVLERIEELEGMDRVDIFYRNCQITYSDESNEYLRGGKDCNGIKGETKLLAVYQSVVEFIEWYNTITPDIYYED